MISGRKNRKIAVEAANALRLRLARCSVEVRGQSTLNVVLSVTPQRYQHGDPVDGNSLTLKILSGWLVIELENCRFDRDSVIGSGVDFNPSEIVVDRKFATAHKGTRAAGSKMEISGGISGVVPKIGASVSNSPSIDSRNIEKSYEFHSAGMSFMSSPNPDGSDISFFFSPEFVASIGHHPWISADVFRIIDKGKDASVTLFLEVMGNENGVEILEASGTFGPRNDENKNFLREHLIRCLCAGRWPLAPPIILGI